MRYICQMSLSLLIGDLAKILVAASLSAQPSCAFAGQLEPPAKTDPATPYLQSGIRLFEKRDFAGATLQFKAAARANPRSADALTWLGIAENQLKEYAQAKVDFEAALRIDPTRVPAHYNLALNLIRTGESNLAIEQLKIVVRAQPGVLEPEYNLALLLEQTHSISEALEHLKAAYKADPDDPGVIQHLLIDLFATGREDEARPILDRMQTRDSGEVRRQVGAALIEAGNYKQAVAILEGTPTPAKRNYEEDMLLARAYIGAHEDFKAVDLLKSAEMLDSTGEIAYLLGLAYSDAGATQEAGSAFEYAIQKNPGNGRALYRLGMIESREKDQSTAAISHLREALRLEPGNSAYGIELGKVLLQHDDAPHALAVMERVHADGSEGGERDLLLGIAQIIVRGPNQAVSSLERGVTENPSLALTHNMLGFCYLSLGEIEKAAAAYANASDLDPGSRVFAHGAAAAFDRSNDAGRAMVYAARAAALPDANGEDHFLVGKLLAKTGKDREAILELSQAIALDADLEGAYILLGRTFLHAGNTAQATEWIAKLKDLKKKHEREDAASRSHISPVTSSTLLRGAPVTTERSEVP